MKIAIVGGGIIGLSTGLCLKQNSSHDVTIITDKTTPHTTGDGAAGIWGPYLLDETPLEAQHRWAKETHDLIEKYWNSSEGGLMGISLVSSTRLNLEEFPPIWHDIVYGFRKMDPKETQDIGRIQGKHKHGYEFVTYTIEPISLLPYFLREFKHLGGRMILNQKVTDLTQMGAQFDLIINCTGVWARDLANDPKVGPLRGQVMRIHAPWIYKVVLDDSDDGNYIISNQRSVVLGGTHQSDWNTEPDENDSRFITSGSKAMFPSALEGATKIKDWVGLRPGRPAVRLERETMTSNEGRKIEVIHNYGHGGSGITIFWGCAKDVSKLVQEIQDEKPDARRLQARL
eukprot:maker-scaffold74_size411160-snap-gene-3.15 protein:Tk04224 transcript:maker-scaffold74_size411160-snap-gene-3.15-mRNA-1 annotation:"d-aspartate oxidase-like"